METSQLSPVSAISLSGIVPALYTTYTSSQDRVKRFRACLVHYLLHGIIQFRLCLLVLVFTALVIHMAAFTCREFSAELLHSDWISVDSSSHLFSSELVLTSDFVWFYMLDVSGLCVPSAVIKSQVDPTNPPHWSVIVWEAVWQIRELPYAIARHGRGYYEENGLAI